MMQTERQRVQVIPCPHTSAAVASKASVDYMDTFTWVLQPAVESRLPGAVRGGTTIVRVTWDGRSVNPHGFQQKQTTSLLHPE